MREQISRSRKLRAVVLILSLVVLISACPRRGEYIGTFDLSHYCLEVWNGEYHICGNSEYGVRGDKLVPGKSLAVPASVLKVYPVGTKVMAVYPDGHSDTLVIQDTGRALERLGRIDLPVKSHKQALDLGVIKGVELYTVK
ncbi:MAG: hypothetical protein J1F63_02900 [Oscillospiraceae bacterium]|nr:hypothetical protein [Oscillospiraceae bacterium]